MPERRTSDSLEEVTERPCIRCHHLLPLEGGQLAYCNICGAPQIFLSEELQEEAALQVQQYSERTAAAAEPHAPAGEEASRSERRRSRREHRAGASRWPLAVEYALLSSGIALGLDLAGLVVGPVLVLAWLWAVSAPILTVGFYNNRSRSAPLSPGFAARLGLLTGLLVSAVGALAVVVDLVWSRFVLKNGAVDTQVAAALAQVRASTEAQSGAAAAPVLHLLGIPEFRVGFLLWVGAVSAAMYLVVAVSTAGVAGLLLSRRKPA